MSIGEFVTGSFGKEGVLLFEEIKKTELSSMSADSLNKVFYELGSSSVDSIVLPKIIERFKKFDDDLLNK